MDRYIDLEEIINVIIKKKEQFSNWTLCNIKQISSLLCLPPITSYALTFKDEYDEEYTIGSISRK